MTNNVNSTNPVNTLVKSFKDTLPANLDQQRQFQVQGYRVLWRQLGEAYFVAQNILSQSKADLEAALTERGITKAKPGSNPFLPIVKMLYGEWKTVNGEKSFSAEHLVSDVTVFEPNRSAEKYACVFRYLNKRKDQLTDLQTIVDYIEGFKGNLKGIEDADRAENKKKASSKATLDTADALKRGLAVRGGMDIGSREKIKDLIADFPDDATHGVVWFKVTEDGHVHLMGFDKKLAEDAVEKLAVKRGTSLLNAATEQARRAEVEAAE